jgi:amino acid adenylation domain-containing protein
MLDHHTIEGFQLSPQQAYLWLFQEGCTVYKSHCSLLLGGLLKENQLRAAIEKALSRHEVYRTYLRCLPGMEFPLQVVTERCLFTWKKVNLRDDNPEEQALRLEEIAQEQQQCPIDLEYGPLLHFSLVSLSDHKHILFLDMPVLHSDNRSLVKLMSTIAQCYGTDLEVHRLSETDEVLQYVQFSEWQHVLLDQEESRTGREYWGKLDLSVLSGWGFPYENKSKSTEERFIPACITAPVPNGLSVRLSLLVKHYDTSIADFLLACWHVLLWRLTGQERSIIAVGTDGRVFEELAETAGLLTTYLPMNCSLNAHQRFSDILTQVKQRTDEAHKWQYYWTGANPVHVSNHVEQVNGDVARSPSFPFCFDFSHWPAPSVVDGISFSIRDCHTYQEPFKIKVSAIQKDDHVIIIGFHYNTSLFSIKDIQRVADQYLTLLQSAVERPEAGLCELEILSEKARAELLVAFNAKSLSQPAGEEVAYPAEKCFHHVFEEQVELTPEAIAVVFDDVACGFTSHLTYQELNDKANQLAHLLLRAGVGLDVLVGICLEPSLEIVVGLLGILKVGGAYVPLDPSYPAKRLALLLEETQPALVLTQAHLIADRHSDRHKALSLQDNPTDYTFCLDTLWHRLIQESCTNPKSSVSRENLAYVIYTSGSTGRPKGVMITHQGLSNYLDWSRQYYQVERGYGSIVHSSLAFDLTITSLFLPLVTGRTVLLVPEEQGIEGLVAMIRRNHLWSLRTADPLRSPRGYSFLKLTPAHLELLNHLLEVSELPDVAHALIIGGEALPAETVAAWRKFAPQTRLINEYGPTETVVGCSIHEVSTNDPDTGMVSIGSPIANTQLYILDTHWNPVPIGVTGELFIGGPGVARGYKNRPDLTAERFVPHPFVETGSAQGTRQGPTLSTPTAPVRSGERLYRTGDLARYQPDGTIEFLGRIDQQVKLRGFRIELGEIEATIRGHPAIQECVVLAREDPSGEKRLIAYSVVCQGQTFVADDLRSYLQDRLPAYMIPSAFVPLDALPLLPNGKVNRHALVQEPRLRPTEKRTMVAPRTPIEKALAAIWTDLLNLGQVSISDNFFEVGGHSLSAVQLLNRMNKQFGPWRKAHGLQALSLTTLFQIPTIEQAAALLQEEARPEEPRSLVARGTIPTVMSSIVTIQPAAQEARGTGQRSALSTPTTEKRPFSWVHDGTGDVYWSLNLTKHLRHDRSFYGIQAPGLAGRADPDQDLFYSIEEMAASYIDELLTIQPEGPYSLGGYSFGGLVAFEMARQLQSQGSSVALLAILDSYPTVQDVSTPAEVVGTGLAPVRGGVEAVGAGLAPVHDYAKAIVRIAEALSRSWKKKVSLPYEELCRLQPEAQLTYLLERLRTAQIAPDDMDVSQLRRYIQVDEAHGYCLQRYRPKPYPGRITLFRSEDAGADPSLWSPFSSEPVEVHPVSGDHLSMVDEPYVQSLALQLQQCLDKADVLEV